MMILRLSVLAEIHSFLLKKYVYTLRNCLLPNKSSQEPPVLGKSQLEKLFILTEIVGIFFYLIFTCFLYHITRIHLKGGSLT